jgi:hypothetical protein
MSDTSADISGRQELPFGQVPKSESRASTVAPYLTADILRDFFTLRPITVRMTPLPAALDKT